MKYNSKAKRQQRKEPVNLKTEQYKQPTLNNRERKNKTE